MVPLFLRKSLLISTFSKLLYQVEDCACLFYTSFPMSKIRSAVHIKQVRGSMDISELSFKYQSDQYCHFECKIVIFARLSKKCKFMSTVVVLPK